MEIEGGSHEPTVLHDDIMCMRNSDCPKTFPLCIPGQHTTNILSKLDDRVSLFIGITFYDAVIMLLVDTTILPDQYFNLNLILFPSLFSGRCKSFKCKDDADCFKMSTNTMFANVKMKCLYERKIDQVRSRILIS